jgi:hypothetical protein
VDTRKRKTVHRGGDALCETRGYSGFLLNLSGGVAATELSAHGGNAHGCDAGSAIVDEHAAVYDEGLIGPGFQEDALEG